MGLLDRLSTVLRANINDLVDKAEDPEKMVTQLLMDMENQLTSVKTQVAAAIADQRLLLGKYQESQKHADEWQHKAELAVDQGQDDLAKEALSRRNSYQSTADQLHQQYEEQDAQVRQLKDALHQLETKIEQAKAKKVLLLARSNRAKAENQIRKTMAGLNPENANAGFARMEEKISREEARAKAAAELEGDSLETRFSKLEEGDQLDNDLAALKASRNKS